MLQHKKPQRAIFFTLLAVLLASSTLLAQSQALYKYHFNKDNFHKLTANKSPGSELEEQIFEKMLLDMPGVEGVEVHESHLEILCTANSAVQIRRLLDNQEIKGTYSAKLFFLETLEEPQHKLKFDLSLQKLERKNIKEKIISAPRIVNHYGHLANVSVFSEKPYVAKYAKETNNDDSFSPVVMNARDGISSEILVIRSLNGQFHVSLKIQILKFQKFEKGRQQLTKDNYVTIQIPKISAWEHKAEFILDSLPSTITSTSFVLPNGKPHDKPVKIVVCFEHYKQSPGDDK